MNEIYLGIGGNLGDRLKNISTAIGLISKKVAVPQKISSIYLTEPWGFFHKKYFANAVLMLRSNKPAEEIFKIVSGIEIEMKRQRNGTGYQGRTMDIDILFYGSDIIATDTLIVPHPKVSERLFVLLPMAEIAAQFEHPLLKKNIMELLHECDDKCKIRILKNAGK